MSKFAQLNSLETALSNSTLTIDNETLFAFSGEFYEGMDLDDREFRGEPEPDDQEQSSGDTPGRDSGKPENPDSKIPDEETKPFSKGQPGEEAEEDASGNKSLEDEESFDEETDAEDSSSDGTFEDEVPDSKEETSCEKPDLSEPKEVSQGSISGGHDFEGIRGSIRREVNGSVEITREFDSWYDFVTCVSNENLYAWKNGRRSSHKEAKHFNGTDSFEQAEEMALRTGWPEGRKMLEDFIGQIHPQPMIRPASEFDVAGMFPCVPVYSAGDPSCMFADSETNMRISKPTIRIDFSMNALAYVKIEDMMLRGAAVVSLMKTLEDQGQSVELRLVGASESRRYKFLQKITYKRAGSNFDLDRAAFAIAHPSSFRRFVFALYEQHQEIEAEYQTSYGSTNHNLVPREPNTIFIPNSLGRETPESARAAVKLAAQTVLKDLKQ